MSIRIERVFVRDTGTLLPQNAPSGLTYDLVIEATAGITDGGKVYLLNAVVTDFTALTPGLPPMTLGINLTATTAGVTGGVGVGTATWMPTPSRLEGVLVFPVNITGLLPIGGNELFKYFVALRDTANPLDADAAESEVFTLG